jgi:homoserine dehydrogenase
VRLLQENASYLAQRVGAPLEIARILVRSPDKQRVPGLDRSKLTTDPEALLGDRSIDVFVEVMGGIEPTRTYVERALDAKRSVVTANKMLLARHGPDLLDRAMAAGVDLAFEGSVGGGMPVIRVLRDALASDWVTSLAGIVNGTCNFVLTRMSVDGLGFDEAVREAQAKGYAEADPTLDVDGHDAAHKLVVLAMVAFGARVEAEQVPTEGIRGIEPIDHRFAERFGYTIKHLAIGRDRDGRSAALPRPGQDQDEGIELRVHPALVHRDTPLANVGGVLNAVALEGRALGPCLLSARGAGDLPTGVSVMADIIDCARAWRSGFAGTSTRGMQTQARRLMPTEDVRTRYYLRFQVHDRPGVLARLAGALGDAGVSIEQMVQEGGAGSSGMPVQIVLLTHEARERDVRRALDVIANGEMTASTPRLLRIQE